MEIVNLETESLQEILDNHQAAILILCTSLIEEKGVDYRAIVGLLEDCKHVFLYNEEEE